MSQVHISAGREVAAGAGEGEGEFAKQSFIRARSQLPTLHMQL
jgi:hypothetical protein